MKTIINIKNKKATVIKNTAKMSHTSLSSIITIKDAEIYIGKLPYSSHSVWAFKTTSANKNRLSDMFGNRVFQLSIIKDGLFPTLIHLDKGSIDYDTFVDLFKQKKIAVKEINTELREHSTSYHPRGFVASNRAIDIYCESISD